MVTRRQKRLNELIHQELMMLLPGRVDDPRLRDVMVTRVETTQDLGTAKVYVTVRGRDDDASAIEMLAALEHAGGFLRSELGALGLPRLPELVFTRDRQYESGQRVLDIISQLERSRAEDTDEDEGEPSEPDAAAAGEGEPETPAPDGEG